MPLLVPAALTAWGISLAAIHVPGAAHAMAAGAWIVAIALTVAFTGARRWPRGRQAVAVAAIALSLGGVTAGHVALANGPREAAAGVAVAGGRAVEVTGVVSSKIERSVGGGVRFDLVAEGLRLGGTARALSAPMAVRAQREDLPANGLDLGSSVIVRGTAKRTDAGERAVLVVFATRGVTVRHGPPALLAVTSGMRQGFVTLSAVLPDPGGGLLPGLAVGDTSAVGDGLHADMKASSLSHLTAVSGANCAIVVALAFGAASVLRLPRALRMISALVALAGFVVLVTPEPSVLRAATMATIAMVALALDRPGSGLGVLAAAVVVALVSDPWLAASLGFALSAAATAGLLLLAGPIAVGLERLLPSTLAVGLSLPLSAQIACGPLLVLIDPHVPLYGVVANLLAAPAAPAATIVGLAACLLQPFGWVAVALTWVAWLPAAWIAGVAETVAALPAAEVPWLSGLPGAALLGAVGAAVVAVLALHGRRTRFLRVGAALALAMLTGSALGTVLLESPLAPLTAPQRWSVAQCDVGQGDALVLRSAGAVAVVDTGPDEALLRRCLDRLAIARVDLLVLTHFDLDHVGGLGALQGRVDTVLHGPPGDDADGTMLRRLARGGARAVSATAGMTGMLGDAAWRVLWPRPGAHAFATGNDASVVLEVSRTGDGMPRTLLLGDLSEAPQRALLATAAIAGRFDVVKVAHHGSGDQHAALYTSAGARLALIGVGAGNDYGHPRAELLGLLDTAGMDVARSDRDGLVLVSRDAERLLIWRDRAGETVSGGH